MADDVNKTSLEDGFAGSSLEKRPFYLKPAGADKFLLKLGKFPKRLQTSSVDEKMTFEAMGEEGITRLTAAFYRLVRKDDLIGPMYPAEDWEGSEERLRDFLLFRIGGKPDYLEKRGHPRLRMRHVPFAIGEKERDRWLDLMAAAMDETAVPVEARLWLEPFFAQVADFMRNRPD